MSQSLLHSIASVWQTLFVSSLVALVFPTLRSCGSVEYFTVKLEKGIVTVVVVVNLRKAISENAPKFIVEFFLFSLFSTT